MLRTGFSVCFILHLLEKTLLEELLLKGKVYPGELMLMLTELVYIHRGV